MAKQLKEYIVWQVTKFYKNTTTFKCVVECEELEKNYEFCVYTLEKFKVADPVNYQHFKNFVEAYEIAHSDKSKNNSQTAVGRVWKKMEVDFPAANELEEVERQANEWKILSFTKKI